MEHKSGKHQWEPVIAHKKKNLCNENIFVRFTQYESKKRGTINRMQINIGDRIAKLFNLEIGHKINIYFDRANVNLFLLKIDKEDGDYTLSKAPKGVVLTANCVIPYPLIMPQNTTQLVFFDVESDDSILIDVSRKPK